MINKILWSIITVSSRLLVSFGIFFILAKFTTQNIFGIAIYQYTLAVIISLFVDFGSNLRLSKDLVKLDRINREKLITETLIQKTILSLISIFLITIFFINDDNFYTLIILVLSQCFNIIGSTYFPLLRTQEKFKTESNIVLINNIFTLLVFLLYYYFFNEPLYSFAISFLFGKTILLLLFIFNNKYIFNNENGFNFDFKYMTPFFLHASLGFLYINIDTIIIKELLGFEDVAIYQVAMKVLLAVCILIEIFSNIYLPYIIKFGYDINRKIIFKKHNELFFLTILIGAILSVFCYILLYYISPVILGSNYVFSSYFCFLISLVVFMRYFGVYPGILITISNKQYLRVVGGFLALLALIISLYFYIPKYGIFGAALSTFIAHVIINLVYLYGSYNIRKDNEIPN